MTGKFHITIGNQSLRNVAASVSGGDLQQLMNLAFPDEGGESTASLSGCL